MVQATDPYDGRKVAKNQILEMVQNELQLDCNYQNASMNLLVRIDRNTATNPILKEWWPLVWTGDNTDLSLFIINLASGLKY